MLTQHKFYVYHEEDRVMARMDNLPAVIAKVCVAGKNADGEEISAFQAAHDEVQRIANPKAYHPSRFGRAGFTHQDFQKEISPNCEAYVKAAYAAAGGKNV